MLCFWVSGSDVLKALEVLAVQEEQPVQEMRGSVGISSWGCEHGSQE